MDGERIIKLSGQGSVYIRCLEPLEEEDKDEEDEQLMTPAYHLYSDNVTENPSETTSQIQLRRSKTVSLHPSIHERHSLKMQCLTSQKCGTISPLTVLTML